MGVIYSIINPKGRMYIGQTYDLRKRIICHISNAKTGSDLLLHKSIRKYGWENHILDIIEEVDDKMMSEREMYWIEKYNTFRYNNKMGMNLTRGGEGYRGKWSHDIERVKKASEKLSGSGNHFYGRKHTEETKKQLGKLAYDRCISSGQIIPEWGVRKMLELCSKPIVCYNLKGDFLSNYKSCAEAARQLNLNVGDISVVARGEQVHSHNLIFRFYEETYPFKISTEGMVFKRMAAPILLLDLKGNIVKEYKQAKDAAKELNKPAGSITRAALKYKGKPLRYTNYVFMYKEEYEQNQVINN